MSDSQKVCEVEGCPEPPSLSCNSSLCSPLLPLFLIPRPYGFSVSPWGSCLAYPEAKITEEAFGNRIRGRVENRCFFSIITSREKVSRWLTLAGWKIWLFTHLSPWGPITRGPVPPPLLTAGPHGVLKWMKPNDWQLTTGNQPQEDMRPWGGLGWVEIYRKNEAIKNDSGCGKEGRIETGRNPGSEVSLTPRNPHLGHLRV